LGVTDSVLRGRKGKLNEGGRKTSKGNTTWGKEGIKNSKTRKRVDLANDVTGALLLRGGKKREGK